MKVATDWRSKQVGYAAELRAFGRRLRGLHGLLPGAFTASSVVADGVLEAELGALAVGGRMRRTLHCGSSSGSQQYAKGDPTDLDTKEDLGLSVGRRRGVSP